MFRTKLIIAIAVTMVFAQLQCVAACASNWCGPDLSTSQSAPLCHHHHDHSQDRTPASCGHQLMNPPATSPHSVQMRAPIMVPIGLVASLVGVVRADVRVDRLHPAAFSPPEAVRPAPSVLRI
jgi:hypothetical protein